MSDLVSFYEMSKSIVGVVPPEYEILYFIVTVALIFCTLLVIMSPLLLFRSLGGR